MAVKDLKTSELLDRIAGEAKDETMEEMVEELMGRFPFGSIEKLEKRIDLLEFRVKRLLNHLHSQDGRVYTREE